MEAIYQTVEHIVLYIARFGICLSELAGIAVLLHTAIRCFIRYFAHEERVQLKLAQGISLALQFKLGAEVLRTVVVREFSELAILGAIIVLRGVLTIMLHWEIKREEAKENTQNPEEKTEKPAEKKE